MNISFIGCGNVGGALAVQLTRAGHAVTLAARDAQSASVQKLLARQPGIAVAAPADAVKAAEVVFLATPYAAAEAALRPLAAALRGKILVDCTNPIGPGLTHGLNSSTSGTQTLQALVPQTPIVKAFTIYGFENFENPAYPGYNVKPAMFYCGDDRQAKTSVAALIEQLGWRPLDVGDSAQALHLEHMTLLWVRLVRVSGHSPNIVWAALER
jgi:predicted dinucleotide-binding enzyme